MTLKKDKPCQGGCGKVRSILYSDSPTDWLCNDCRTKAQQCPDCRSPKPSQHPQDESGFITLCENRFHDQRRSPDRHTALGDDII